MCVSHVTLSSALFRFASEPHDRMKNNDFAWFIVPFLFVRRSNTVINVFAMHTGYTSIWALYFVFLLRMKMAVCEAGIRQRHHQNSMKNSHVPHVLSNKFILKNYNSISFDARIPSNALALTLAVEITHAVKIPIRFNEPDRLRRCRLSFGAIVRPHTHTCIVIILFAIDMLTISHYWKWYLWHYIFIAFSLPYFAWCVTTEHKTYARRTFVWCYYSEEYV